MENELGIKICCENCECSGGGEYYCYKSRNCNYDKFTPTSDVYENRIRELQTELEKINRLYDYKQDLYRDLCIRYEEAINHNKTKGQK